MGLFGGNPPEKRRRQRKTPAERLAAQEADYLGYLKKNKPEKWQQVMEERMGIGGSRDKEKPDNLKVTMETIAMMKKAGFIKGPQDVEDNSSSFVHEILAAIPALPAVFQMMQQQAAQPQPAPREDPPASVTPRLAAPAPGQPEPAHEADTQEAEGNMNMLVEYLKANLGSKSAPDAARWLAGQSHPMAAQLVATLAEIPEGEAFGWLLNTCSAQPELKSLGRWIESQGELWVRSIARELKVLRGGPVAYG